MAGNRGKTSLKAARRGARGMRDFDGLPQGLRRWLTQARLPWRPGSVRRVYDKALSRTGDPAAALAELDRIERAMLARDAAHVWGPAHPGLSGGAGR